MSMVLHVARPVDEASKHQICQSPGRCASESYQRVAGRVLVASRQTQLGNASREPECFAGFSLKGFARVAFEFA